MLLEWRYRKKKIIIIIENVNECVIVVSVPCRLSLHKSGTGACHRSNPRQPCAGSPDGLIGA